MINSQQILSCSTLKNQIRTLTLSVLNRKVPINKVYSNDLINFSFILVITDLVTKLDNVTEYWHRKIQEHNLENRVSVVHISDHGMDSLELRNVVDLSKIVDSKKIKFYGTTPVLQIVPNNLSDTEDIYNKLHIEAQASGKFKVYKDEELPERWHFRNKIRVGPITAVADLGYGFQDMFSSAEWYKKAYNITPSPTQKYGVHGYDNIFESMHPIFFAYGHRIKTKHVVDAFDTVDLFYLFCDILGLEAPSYLKGNREHILGILTDNGAERLSRWMVLSKLFNIYYFLYNF